MFILSQYIYRTHCLSKNSSLNYNFLLHSIIYCFEHNAYISKQPFDKYMTALYKHSYLNHKAELTGVLDKYELLFK